ncbi:MAG: PDZ domain-containing protein [Fibrobacteria bacterium]|nr:PDZ domain-containing protein [Fibrobacteria bacterium]
MVSFRNTYCNNVIPRLDRGIHEDNGLKSFNLRNDVRWIVRSSRTMTILGSLLTNMAQPKRQMVACRALLLLLFLSLPLFAQPAPLGEAVRQNNVQKYRNLHLNKLPSPKEQNAAGKQFSEGHWHGLEVIPLSQELAQEYDIPAGTEGLLIDETVLEACEDGFFAGDVIQSIEHYPTRSLEEFLQATMKVQGRKSVRIQIWRSAHTQALTGDIGIVENLKARAQTMNKTSMAGHTLTLTLTASPIYHKLGYANMDAAPPIQPGSIPPHKTRQQNQKCTDCHVFMNTGGQLAVDAGDLVPNPPDIVAGTIRPHEPRGQCNFCHQIVKDSLSTAYAPVPSGQAAAFVQPPTITKNAVCPHNPRGDCNTCHTILKDGNVGAALPHAPKTPTGQNVSFPQFLLQPKQGAYNLLDSTQPHGSEYKSFNQNRLKWLGIEALSVNHQIAQQFGLVNSHGVLIEAVDPTSPAKGVGLKAGDIITHVGNIRLQDLNHLNQIVAPLQSGEEIQLTIIRDGKMFNLGFFLGKNPGTSLGRGSLNYPSPVKIIWILGAFILVYVLVINNLVSRIIAFPIGAGLVLFIGYTYGFYDIFQALDVINFNVLIFIFSMNFMTTVLNEAGLFSYLSKKIALVTLGDQVKQFVLFCILTYGISAFVDNIATIMVVVPLTLALSRELNFDPRPLIIGEIIASNLGGASTMFGDFPNLLISMSTDLQFTDFLMYELPACLIMLAVMLIYIIYSHKAEWDKHPIKYNTRLFNRIRKDLKTAITNKPALIKGLSIFALVIVGLIIAAPLGVNPTYIVLGGGILLLLTSGINQITILKQGGWNDVIFFAALFVMVGGAEASGLLSFIADDIIFRFSSGNILASAILLMWFAAFFTAFMNAGPTAAIFIPIIINIDIIPPNNLYWWALSLGVLSGSSATLYGASGGPLASSLIGKFIKINKKNIGPESLLYSLKRQAISFQDYFKIGGPILLMFLIISTLYVSFLYYIS